MIALLALQAVLSAPTAMPDTLPRQALPARGCAAYLWSSGDAPRLVAMAVGDPASLRLSLGGKPADYARTGQSGVGGFGFAGSSVYQAGDTTATLAMTILARPDLADGATVPDGTLTIARSGTDTLVLPVAGLIGCAPSR
jgi:hypothetical protein